MKLHIEKENRETLIRFSGTVAELLRKMRLNPEAVLVARNNELLTADDEIKDEDEIKILSVISGG